LPHHQPGGAYKGSGEQNKSCISCHTTSSIPNAVLLLRVNHRILPPQACSVCRQLGPLQVTGLCETAALFSSQRMSELIAIDSILLCQTSPPTGGLRNAPCGRSLIAKNTLSRAKGFRLVCAAKLVPQPNYLHEYNIRQYCFGRQHYLLIRSSLPVLMLLSVFFKDSS
jgi:hypothetical protein